MSVVYKSLIKIPFVSQQRGEAIPYWVSRGSQHIQYLQNIQQSIRASTVAALECNFWNQIVAFYKASCLIDNFKDEIEVDQWG